MHPFYVIIICVTHQSMRNTNLIDLWAEMHHQDYFGFAEDTRLGRVCETQISKNPQAYRSGHNEAVLKTVCLTGTGVRIPQPAPLLPLKITHFQGFFISFFTVFYQC